MKSRLFATLALAALATPLAEAQTRIDPADRTAWVGFGTTVVVDGDMAYIGKPGVPGFFPMPASETGAVFVFAATEDGWSQVAAVTVPGVGIGFGSAIAVTEGSLFVGAPGANGGTGAVYVFHRDGMTWEEKQVLQPPAESGEFGAAITVAGGVAYVGAPGHNAGAGAVATYARRNGDWERTGLITAETEPGERFGAAIAVGRGALFAGAPGSTSIGMFTGPGGLLPGKVHVFESSADGWALTQTITTEVPGAAMFGATIIVNGERLLVGTPGGAGLSGWISQFTPDGSAWVEGSPIMTQVQGPSLFGLSMAVAGTDLLVGSPLSGGGAGAVQVFRRSGAEWNAVQSLSVTASGMAATFGIAVAAGDGFVVAAAPGADFFEGLAYVFTQDDDGSWIQSDEIVDATGAPQPLVGEQIDCEGGGAAGFGCSDVDLLSFIPVRALGADRGIMVNDVWGWTDPDDGDEYAIVGRFDGTSFIDVTDPSNPTYLGFLPKHEGTVGNLWRDIKVYDNHAFIVADGAGPHGMQIFDLTQLRAVANPPATFTETAHYDGLASAHNLVINEATGFAFAVGVSSGGETCGGGLHMIDIREPTNPTFAGCFSDPQTGNAGTGYSHDAQCIVYHGPDAAYEGKEICFGANETAISIADVTDKDNPIAISRASYPNVAYSHQGWVSDDHRYFFLNDELDELSGIERTRTLVWDIEDLDDPVLVTEYMGETSATDHNLYVRDGFMYQSNYVSGLRIIDVRDPEHPTEVGYFDTVPLGENVPGFLGSWSNYPFFESGSIIVTSMREGLFVLKQRPRELVP